MPALVAGQLLTMLVALGVPGQIVGMLGGLALSPLGDRLANSEDDLGLMLHHVWPHNVATRKELILRLSSCGNSTLLRLRMAAMMKVLAVMADRGTISPEMLRSVFDLPDAVSLDMAIAPAMTPLRKEMERDQAGLFDKLLGDDHWPHMAVGLCLEPMIAEGSLMFTNSRLDIRKGDLVAYAAKGLPSMGCKVYLGEDRGKVFFWCNKPAAVYVFDYDQLLHVSRVSWIKPHGAPLVDARTLDFSPLYSEGGRIIFDQPAVAPFIGPKCRDIFAGLDKALFGIVKALQMLPRR